jgi:hypothetical protein
MLLLAGLLSVLLAAPVVALRDLPAVSGDGATVAVRIVDSDGARGNPNLALGLIDAATDRVVRRFVIQDANDPERPGVAAREVAANALLEGRSWTRLVAMRVEKDTGAPTRSGGLGGPFEANRAAGSGLSVEYREPVLVVRDTATGRELLRRAVPTWSQRGGPRCAGCIDCPPPLASMAGAAVDPARHTLLVDVEYRGGTDLCWEPGDTHHVVRLP